MGDNAGRSVGWMKYFCQYQISTGCSGANTWQLCVITNPQTHTHIVFQVLIGH